MVDTKKLLEEARNMRQKDMTSKNPYPRTFIKTRNEKGLLFQRGEESYFCGLEKGSLEGNIEVREDEYIFRGHLVENLLRGTQTVFHLVKGEENVHFSFEVLEGAIKNTKTTKELKEEKR